MIKTRMYKFAKQKAYFDAGYGASSYVKVLIGFTTLATMNPKLIAITVLVYGVLCYFVGYLMFRYKFIEAEKEVLNQNDLFVKEVRKTKVI